MNYFGSIPLKINTLAPAGSISYDAIENDIIIKVGTLIGESVTDLNNTQVVEFFGKLHDAARAAQLTYNANNGTPLPVASQVTSFPAATNGAVQTTSGGDDIVIRTQSISSRIPLNLSNRLPNLGTL